MRKAVALALVLFSASAVAAWIAFNSPWYLGTYPAYLSYSQGMVLQSQYEAELALAAGLATTAFLLVFLPWFVRTAKPDPEAIAIVLVILSMVVMFCIVLVLLPPPEHLTTWAPNGTKHITADAIGVHGWT